jgi:hypothetical protein
MVANRQVALSCSKAPRATVIMPSSPKSFPLANFIRFALVCTPVSLRLAVP